MPDPATFAAFTDGVASCLTAIGRMLAQWQDEMYAVAQSTAEADDQVAILIMPNSQQINWFTSLPDALFGDFVNWESTAQGMLRFVEQYGLLERPPGGGTGSVSAMLTEQRALRSAYDAYREGDASEVMVALEMDRAGMVRPRLLPKPVAGADERVFEGPVRAEDLELVFAPVSLPVAMWLQLAYEVKSEKRLITCEYCGKSFYTGTEPSGAVPRYIAAGLAGMRLPGRGHRRGRPRFLGLAWCSHRGR